MLEEIIKNNGLVLAYFSQPSCNVCTTLKPKVKDLLKVYPAVEFVDIDLLEKQEYAGAYSVFAIPTIILFVEGKEGKRFSRNFSINELDAFLNRMTTLMA